jgi:hypothetical protein
MRRLATTVAALALVLLTSSPAHAGSTVKKDKDDASGVLDLSKVSLTTKGSKVIATLTTHDAWSDAEIAGTSAGMGLSFKMGAAKNRDVLIAAYSGTLTASICTIRIKDLGASACTDLALERVSARTLKVTIPRSKIAKGADTYRWNAGSIVPEGTAGCTQEPFCQDHLPQENDAWYTWRP